MTINRSDFDQVILGQTKLADLIHSGTAKLEGDAQALLDFLGLLDRFDFRFNIVTP